MFLASACPLRGRIRPEMNFGIVSPAALQVTPNQHAEMLPDDRRVPSSGTGHRGRADRADGSTSGEPVRLAGVPSWPQDPRRPPTIRYFCMRPSSRLEARSTGVPAHTRWAACIAILIRIPEWSLSAILQEAFVIGSEIVSALRSVSPSLLSTASLIP